MAIVQRNIERDAALAKRAPSKQEVRAPSKQEVRAPSKQEVAGSPEAEKAIPSWWMEKVVAAYPDAVKPRYKHLLNAALPEETDGPAAKVPVYVRPAVINYKSYARASWASPRLAMAFQAKSFHTPSLDQKPLGRADGAPSVTIQHSPKDLMHPVSRFPMTDGRGRSSNCIRLHGKESAMIQHLPHKSLPQSDDMQGRPVGSAGGVSTVASLPLFPQKGASIQSSTTSLHQAEYCSWEGNAFRSLESRTTASPLGTNIPGDGDMASPDCSTILLSPSPQGSVLSLTPCPSGKSLKTNLCTSRETAAVQLPPIVSILSRCQFFEVMQSKCATDGSNHSLSSPFDFFAEHLTSSIMQLDNPEADPSDPPTGLKKTPWHITSPNSKCISMCGEAESVVLPPIQLNDIYNTSDIYRLKAPLEPPCHTSPRRPRVRHLTAAINSWR